MTAMTMMMINLNMRKSDLVSCSVAVVDPGFSRWEGGAGNPRGECGNLSFCKIFSENCMKMKEFGPKGNVRNWHPLGSITVN